MITCTFAGHREVFQSNIPKRLDEALSKIITTDENEYCFLVGGMGEFDGMCSSAVRRAKKKYASCRISLELVLPYFSQELNTNKEYYEQSYDNVLIPSELAGVHYKSVITKLNHWMVDESEYVICYVYRNFGGAYTTMKYAKKKEKRVINLAETNS